eukprot:1033421-Pyramimonas_sp.AAC.1
MNGLAWIFFRSRATRSNRAPSKSEATTPQFKLGTKRAGANYAGTLWAKRTLRTRSTWNAMPSNKT